MHLSFLTSLILRMVLALRLRLCLSARKWVIHRLQHQTRFEQITAVVE